jgi:hypothetical protein
MVKKKEKKFNPKKTLNPLGAISAVIIPSGGLEERTGFAKLHGTSVWSH